MKTIYDQRTRVMAEAAISWERFVKNHQLTEKDIVQVKDASMGVGAGAPARLLGLDCPWNLMLVIKSDVFNSDEHRVVGHYNGCLILAWARCSAPIRKSRY